MLKDYQQFGHAAFTFEIIDELEDSEEEGYEHEYQLIQQLQATHFCSNCMQLEQVMPTIITIG